MKKFKIFSLVLCAVMLFTACGAKAPLSKEQAVNIIAIHSIKDKNLIVFFIFFIFLFLFEFKI